MHFIQNMWKWLYLVTLMSVCQFLLKRWTARVVVEYRIVDWLLTLLFLELETKNIRSYKSLRVSATKWDFWMPLDHTVGKLVKHRLKTFLLIIRVFLVWFGWNFVWRQKNIWHFYPKNANIIISSTDILFFVVVDLLSSFLFIVQHSVSYVRAGLKTALNNLSVILGGNFLSQNMTEFCCHFTQPITNL